MNNRRFCFPVCLIICLVLLCTSICTGSRADTVSGTLVDINWELTDEGQLTVSGQGKMSRAALLGSLYNAWYPYMDKITSVIICEGVTDVANKAFKDCVNLKIVTMPEGVTEIGHSAFMGCKNLETINFPEGLESIDENAFYDCQALEKVQLPESMTEIGKNAFCNCLNLLEIYIPKNVTSIGDGNFKNCGSIDSTVLIHNSNEMNRYWKGRYFHLVVTSNSAAEKYAIDNGLSYDDGKKMTLGWKARMLDKVDSIVKQCIKDNMNEKQKAKALHDWLTHNVSYGEAPNTVYEGSDAALLQGKGYCFDYATAYRLLLMKAGMASVLINGAEINHTWNLVRINGKWYHVDTTWDAPKKSKYFMLTDKQMKADHTWDTSEYSADKGLFPEYCLYEP